MERTAGSDRNGGTEIGFDGQTLVRIDADPVYGRGPDKLLAFSDDLDWQSGVEAAIEHVETGRHHSATGHPVARCRRGN